MYANKITISFTGDANFKANQNKLRWPRTTKADDGHIRYIRTLLDFDDPDKNVLD